MKRLQIHPKKMCRRDAFGLFTPAVGLRNILLMILLSLVGQLAFAASFTTIRLEPRVAPQGFENGKRYEIAYFIQNEESLDQVDPTSEEKIESADLILAGVVRELLRIEYTEKGFKQEIQQVQPTTVEEIIALASGKFPAGSPAWVPENLKNLTTYLSNSIDSLKLYKMEVRVEIDGNIIEQAIPLIIRPKVCPGQRDMVTLFFVTTQKYSKS